MKLQRGILLVVILMGAPSVRSQSVNLIQSELDGIRSGLFELGPFYATPSVRVTTGYDSNVLSSSVPESDVTFLFGPGVELALPIASSAFFELYQEVDLVYYREQVDLRRVFNVTRAGGGFGGRRFLFRVDDEFRDETGRPTSEFDFPVQQRTNALDSSLRLALGWRHELRFAYAQTRFEIRDASLDDGTVTERLNRVEDRASLDLTRKLTAKTVALAEGFYERFDFDDPSRDAESYGARFGFDFSPGRSDPLASRPFAQPFLAGRLLLGFRTVGPFEAERVDFTGLIADVDVTFGFGRGHTLQGRFGRDVEPSIFQDNWYFIETRWGGSFRLQLTERFSISPGAIIGKNDYPLPTLVESEGGELVEEEIFDDHTIYRLAVDVRIAQSLTVGVTTDYLDRQSNVRAFAKDRLQVSLNLRYQP